MRASRRPRVGRGRCGDAAVTPVQCPRARLLPAACCLLPAACCLLPAACCLLSALCRQRRSLSRRPRTVCSSQIRCITLDAADAAGPVWARHLALSLRRGEEFVLQVDSHMR